MSASYGAFSSSSSKHGGSRNFETESGSSESNEVYVPAIVKSSSFVLAIKTAVIVFVFAGLSVFGVSLSKSYNGSNVAKMTSTPSFLE